MPRRTGTVEPSSRSRRTPPGVLGQIRAGGADTWLRAHVRRYELFTATMWLTWIAVMSGVLAFLQQFVPNSHWNGLALAVLVTGTWLWPVLLAGRAQSLRYDTSARDSVAIADIIGEPVPAHPPWWEEHFHVRGRRIPLSWAITAGVGGALAMVVLPAWTDTPAFLVALAGAFLAYVGVIGLRDQRCHDFRRHVHEQLAANGATGLRSERERLLVELAALEQQMNAKRAELAELDRSSGLAGFVSRQFEALQTHLDAQGADAELRGRHWDVRLAVLLALPSAVIGGVLGFFIGALGKHLFGFG